MNIESYFSKKNIITNLAKYEMFYQVALGSLVNSANTKDTNYEIEFQFALGSIYELLKELEEIENINDIFENELKKQAAMDAVQFFVNENLELIKQGSIEIEPIVNQINDNEFFNEAMIQICDNNLESQLSKWESVITDELSTAILQSLKDLENQ